MKKNELSKGFFYGMIAICMVLIIFVGIGFGVFAAQPKPIVYQDENGGNIVINYTNNISGLKIEDVVPTVDSVAMKSSDDNEEKARLLLRENIDLKELLKEKKIKLDGDTYG